MGTGDGAEVGTSVGEADGASLGSVKGVRISIKEVGGPYDACRPLAGSLAPG